MSYTVKEVVALPVFEEREVYTGVTVPVPTGESIRKEPGDTISDEEFEEAHQSQEDIQRLIDDEAIEEAS